MPHRTSDCFQVIDRSTPVSEVSAPPQPNRSTLARLALALISSALICSAPLVAQSPPPPLPAASTAPPAAVTPELVELDPQLFPIPDNLRPNIAFWTNVFTRYTSDHIVLHDEQDTSRVYAVLDFTALSDAQLSEVEKRKRQSRALTAEQAKVRGALLQLADGQSPADPDLASELPSMFAGEPSPRAAYRAAAETIRTQRGLADEFERALVRSGRYLPAIETTFRDRGLPVELSRLPFVESMFQAHARSKVAAGGMWQIMPATGKRVMKVGKDLDERFDPFLAAEAAARFLRENHDILQAWPLAITAYNYGTNGMARAVRNLGTRDLGTIIDQHQSRTFGFASKNFYAEFVAATLVYENREHYFPGVISAPAVRFDEFTPSRYVSLLELTRRAQANTDALRPLNPALHDDVWSGRLLVPAGYRLRVPEGQGEAFQRAYEALPDSLKLARQAGERYRVRPGDTLSKIARHHGTSVRAIQQENNMGGRTTIRIGQVLRIPPGGAASRTAVTARATPSRPTVHVVKSGETLGQIARRYRTTVSTLMSLNGIRDAARIYTGQRLKVKH